MQPGEIFHHSRFYVDRTTGEYKGKYLLIPAVVAGDLIFRPLTSQPRPEVPECHHGLPYPSFYLGVLGGRLRKKSWLDLTKRADMEVARLRDEANAGIATCEATLAQDLFLRALQCVAGANDTTPVQEKTMRDLLAILPYRAGMK